jgi:predicted transcriptional regulator
MNLQAEKIQLAKMVLSIENKSIVQQIKDVLYSSKADWWNTISKEEQKVIKEGIADLDNGLSKPHKEVMKNQIRHRTDE